MSRKPTFSRRSVLKGTGTLAAGTLALAGGAAAQPVRQEVEVEMSDGVTIRGQLYYPADGNGDIADGEFPVIATFEPYKREDDETGPSPPRGTAELVSAGYIRAEFEIRGTGGSGGRFRNGDAREEKDFGELIYWLADHKHSNGKIGLYGLSYKGLSQYRAVRGLTRVEAPDSVPESPIEALFPIVTGVDGYRNVLFNGGLYDTIFASFWLPYVTGTPMAAGALAADDMSPEEVVDTEQSHLAGAFGGASTIAGAHLGTEAGYRNEETRESSWEHAFPHVVDQDIPVFTVQGWHDIFQPGVAHVYTQLQNLWAGRDQFGPMDPNQRVSGRYQCAIGSYYHVSDYGDLPLAKRWFDRFLKGKRNGIDETETPLHLFQLFGDRWADARTWPLPEFGERSIETYYLNPGRTGTASHSLNDGALQRSAPEASEASDPLPWRLHNPCHQGTAEEGTFGLTPQNACTDSGRTFEAGALTYTTPAFDEGRNVAGPIAATLYAAAETTNTSWAIALNDAAPDGTSTLISKGQLLGSFRELNTDRSWYVTDDGQPGNPPKNLPNQAGRSRSSDGTLLRPNHDYTQESEQPVEPGAVERYDILMDPVFARLRPGHRLRLAIRTNASWAQPLAKDADDVVGTYQVQRTSDHASALNIPFVEGPVPQSSTEWGPCPKDCGTAYNEN